MPRERQKRQFREERVEGSWKLPFMKRSFRFPRTVFHCAVCWFYLSHETQSRKNLVKRATMSKFPDHLRLYDVINFLWKFVGEFVSQPFVCILFSPIFPRMRRLRFTPQPKTRPIRFMADRRLRVNGFNFT